MKKGGYKIVDLGGVNMTIGTPVNVVNYNIYDAIENNYGKPILLSGIKIADIERPDTFVNFITVADNKFRGFMYVSSTGKTIVLDVDGGESPTIQLTEI